MQTAMVYLATPIDYADPNSQAMSQLQSAVTEVHDYAAAVGLVVYSPADAFHVGKGAVANPDTITLVNWAALEASSAVIAIWPRGVESVGVGLELGWAMAKGMPVGLITDRDSWSVQSLRNIPHMRRAHSRNGGVVVPGVFVGQYNPDDPGGSLRGVCRVALEVAVDTTIGLVDSDCAGVYLTKQRIALRQGEVQA